MTLALRSASVNRLVRGKLLISSVLFAIAAVLSAALDRAPLSPEFALQIRTFLPLLLAFGVITLVVVLTINPWRADRVPDRFPNIVQDAIAITLFALVATLILQEKILATTAVGAVVIGFALQDTLGNLFAGLAIQIEKPFRVGDWVTIGDRDGKVSEITWRATKIRTKAGNLVIVPNSVLARDTITNYSAPTTLVRLEVQVGATYDVPPNDVKAAILEGLRDEPLVALDHSPEVLLADFAASAITYTVRFWIDDFSADERARDRVRSRIYYAFGRHGIAIPYPIQVQIEAEAAAPTIDATKYEDVLEAVDVFASLTSAQRVELLQATRPRLYADGETIVRQGDAGTSMFVVATGQAVVLLAGSKQEVARLGPGAFFGEMSLLTGAPRSASVKAATDARLLEITGDAFRRFVLANPTAVELIGEAVAVRAAELEQRRAESSAMEPVESAPSFLKRIRTFLHLPGGAKGGSAVR